MSYAIEDTTGFMAVISRSRSIIVTAHLFPDFDAVCSSLLLARTLKLNYPGKRIQVVLEDKPRSMYAPEDTLEIVTAPVLDALQLYEADCVILLDANRFSGATRTPEKELLSFIAERNVSTIVIDHHERVREGDFDVRVQDPSIPAATQVVYRLCFQKLNFQRPADIDQITMLGIVDDCGLFTYGYDDYSDTFSIINELMGRGATIQHAASVMSRLNAAQMLVISELAGNIQVEADYAYSYVSDEFWQRSSEDCDPVDFKSACTIFGNSYISNIENREWGFVIYPNPLEQSGEYRVSFRSQVDSTQDIAEFTDYLGSSSGHRHAAGANLKVANVQAALRKILNAIAYVRAKS